MNEYLYNKFSKQDRSNYSLNFLLIELKNKIPNYTEDRIIAESENQQCVNQHNTSYDCLDFYKRISRYL